MGDRIAAYTEQIVEKSEAKTVPDLVPGVIRVHRLAGLNQRVDFLCPCGCGERIMLFVKTFDSHPEMKAWTYSSGPSLSPSVRLERGCRSHFEITRGAVVWAKE